MSSRELTQFGVAGFDVDIVEVMRTTLIGMYLLIFLMPLIWSFSVSFRPRDGVRGAAPHLIPHSVTFKWWIEFFQATSKFLVNTVLIAVGVSVIVMIVAIPAAYAFSRLEFPGRRPLFYGIVAITLIPEIMLVLPMNEIVQWLGLFDTIAGQWLAIMISGMVVAVWMLRDNFEKLPSNAEEAARVYGCTQFTAFVRVILPLSTPVIIGAAFFSFVRSWTEFFFSSMLTTSKGAQQAIVYLFYLLGPDKVINWPFVMAGSFIIGLPPAILYIFARRYLEEAFSF